MKRNNYIAYALWFLGAFSWIAAMPIGGGLHRIYCGKFISGFAQIALFWLGSFTVVFSGLFVLGDLGNLDFAGYIFRRNLGGRFKCFCK